MAKGSRKTLVIQSEKLPIIEGVEEYAQMGLIPEGAYRNRDFAGDEVRSEIKELWMEDLVFDPQTSGGLLLAVPAEEADVLAEELASFLSFALCRTVLNALVYGIAIKIFEYNGT